MRVFCSGSAREENLRLIGQFQPQSMSQSAGFFQDALYLFCASANCGFVRKTACDLPCLSADTPQATHPKHQIFKWLGVCLLTAPVRSKGGTAKSISVSYSRSGLLALLKKVENTQRFVDGRLTNQYRFEQ